ncbi:helix-turn-helix domain-containing protein [Limnoglobus roseus]|uniref:Helix-turn-helix domain-containing protein n=1 Tax=Limnoglobus roseus TaxID=2598579 RepID=A0A5C1A8V3_9BACT|nr:helix-turn-helix domain-containing protein [Limnoglobus roseus]QEL14633.1 hypothetical protein PX52LOC_01525 [Limnoglobus roseus]
MPTLTAVEKYLRPSQVAAMCGVHLTTLADYCDAGRFPGTIRTAGGHRRIPESSVIAFLQRLNIPAERCETLRERAEREAAASRRMAAIR